jgi:hypothetical protein
MKLSLWRKLFSWISTPGSARSRSKGTRPRFRPGIESLEDRFVLNGGSISGHVLQDLTGNGLVAGAPALSGVHVKIFADTNHDGTLESRDRLVASRFSAADGSYTFSNLAPGTYFVAEKTPGHFVRTAPTSVSYYTVHLAAGDAVTGQDFANFQKPHRNAVSNFSFTVTAPDGTQTTVTDLRGHTQQGDTVTANFTVAAHAGPTVVSLVSYDAPGPNFNAHTASQQQVDSLASGTFGPGPHSLTVTLPNNYYQVDFILGPAITQLGPARSHIFYSAQGRLLSADNGGTQAVQVTPPPAGSLSGNVFGDFTGTGLPGNGNTGLSGQTVTLTGTSDTNQSVNLTTTTDASGNFTFTGLPAGTYTITVTAAPGFSLEPAIIGSLGDGGGTVSATSGTISNISLGANVQGTGYDFGEFVPTA